MFHDVGRVAARSFLVGFGVVAVSDQLYPWQAHLHRAAEVALIHLEVGGVRLYGPLQFGVATVVAVLGWRALEAGVLVRWLGPRSREPLGHAVAAAVLVSLGLGFGWCVSPRIDHHVAWSLALIAASVSLVAALGSRHQLAGFATCAVAGTAVEIAVLDPRLGWWTFTQPDLLGRVPAWEPLVWGWAGVVVHHLAGGLVPAAPTAPISEPRAGSPPADRPAPPGSARSG